MPETWDEARIRREYLDASTAESQRVEYKAAAALGSSDRAKQEIVRDVSSMANASGGLLFYGIKENKSASNQPGIAEDFDPVTDRSLSREWLVQVINNVDPPISDVNVEAVQVSNGTVYVVEIPQGRTAHQATDHRYWRRYTLEKLPMPDDQVRDVMNRSVYPDLHVSFSHQPATGEQHWLIINIRNRGPVAVHHLKFRFVFPDQDKIAMPWIGSGTNRDQTHASGKKYLDWLGYDAPGYSGMVPTPGLRQFDYRSSEILFPEDDRTLDRLGLLFTVNHQVWKSLDKAPPPEVLPWVLYADNMKPKRGELDYHGLIRSVYGA